MPWSAFTETWMPPYDVVITDRDGYTLIEFRGPFSAEAGEYCLAQMAESLSSPDPRPVLFDISRAAGGRSLADRLTLIERGASTLASISRVAVLTRPEQVLPDRAGQSAAAERGLNLRVFTDFDQAVEWLTVHSPKRSDSIEP
jgi:hypothetical protein